MGCGISGLKQENGMQIYNNGEPAPPGWGPTFNCMKLFTVTGIPEGTPKVPKDEEKAILARWQGRYKIVSLSSPPGITGNVVSFTDAHIQGDILEISGGTRMIHTPHGIINMPNQPQKQRLSLWRGADGVLYIDNIGSKLVRESPNEIEIKNALGFGLMWRRTTPPAPMQMERGEEAAPTKWAGRPTSPAGQGVAGGWSESVVIDEVVPESGQKASEVAVEIDGESWPVA